MAEQGTTKEKIAEVALRMFAQRGYEAVSIRDICAEVGVKESTIYYHYTDKRAIYEALLERIRQKMQAMAQAFDLRFADAASVPKMAFVKVTLLYLEQYFCDKDVLPFLRMLDLEKYRDAPSAALFDQLLFEEPLRQQKGVMRGMMEKKIFTLEDPATVATEYQAMLLYAFQRYILRGEPGGVEKAQKLLFGWSCGFYDKHRV